MGPETAGGHPIALDGHQSEPGAHPVRLDWDRGVPYFASMTHTVREKQKLLARVRRIKGQVEASERALEGEAECD